MIKNKKVIAIIPARGGSKGVPRKNIKPLNGRPLISYAISASLKSKFIDRVIVSTDDKEIADVAKKYKAEIPFIRPAELAQDTSPVILAMQHVVKYLEEEEDYKPDLVILLQATTPLVLASDIDSAIEMILESDTNTCVSVCEIVERPEWMYVFEDGKTRKLKPFLVEDHKTDNRQEMPKVYRLNGAIYVTKKDTIMKEGKITDRKKLSAIIMPQERSVDINEPVDFYILEAIIKQINFESLIKK